MSRDFKIVLAFINKKLALKSKNICQMSTCKKHQLMFMLNKSHQWWQFYWFKCFSKTQF